MDDYSRKRAERKLGKGNQRWNDFTHFTIILANMKPMQVQTKDNWKLVVFFDNKNSKEIDCTFLLNYPAFEKLKDPTFFNQAFIHHDTVCWPDNIDLNPDWL